MSEHNAHPFAAAFADLQRSLRPVSSAIRLRDERPADRAARERLLDDSFGPARFGKTCERLARAGSRPRA